MLRIAEYSVTAEVAGSSPVVPAILSQRIGATPLVHTSTPQLAELARKAKPRLLILYHYSGLSREELFDDMIARYAGHFVVGRDLDAY